MSKWILSSSAACMASLQIYEKIFLIKPYVVTVHDTKNDKKFSFIHNHRGYWNMPNGDWSFSTRSDLSLSGDRIVSIKSVD